MPASRFKTSRVARVMVLAVLLACGLASAHEGAPRRFLLSVGQNTGDGADAPLLYAESDARNVAQVFQETGNVRPENLELLLGATSSTLTEAVARWSSRLQREARSTDQLFIYVSGHADEGELHLGGTRFRISELSDLLKRVPVGVAVLILDACRSGALTRSKGLAATPTVIRSHSPGVRGRVVITSSGATEAAQESDRLRGPYFTTHWVAGLRGLADTSGNGEVTLQEVYAYAYERTIASTFSTAGGVQHPNFEVQLRGHGELVLSEPRRAAGQLVIQVPTPGEYLIRAEGGPAVVTHFQKASGTVHLAVAPGAYRVLVREQQGTSEATVRVVGSEPTFLRQADLTPTQVELASRKGSEPPSALSISLGALVAKGGVSGLEALPGAELRIHGTFGTPSTAALQPIWMAEVSFLRGSSTAPPQFTHQELGLSAGGGLRFERGRFAVVGAVEGGVLWMQQLNTPLDPETNSWAPIVLGVLQGQLRLFGPWSVCLGGWAGPTWSPTQQGVVTRLRAGAGLGIAFRP